MPEGITAQTEQTLRNMTQVLAALGLGLGNVVSVRVFLTKFKRDYDEMNKAYAGFFKGDARPDADTRFGVLPDRPFPV